MSYELRKEVERPHPNLTSPQPSPKERGQEEAEPYPQKGNVIKLRKKEKLNAEVAALFTQRNTEGSFILDRNVSLLGRRDVAY